MGVLARKYLAGDWGGWGRGRKNEKRKRGVLKRDARRSCSSAGRNGRSLFVPTLFRKPEEMGTRISSRGTPWLAKGPEHAPHLCHACSPSTAGLTTCTATPKTGAEREMRGRRRETEAAAFASWVQHRGMFLTKRRIWSEPLQLQLLSLTWLQEAAEYILADLKYRLTVRLEIVTRSFSPSNLASWQTKRVTTANKFVTPAKAKTYFQ